MTSIVKIGSKQYSVVGFSHGLAFRVEKLDVKKGNYWTSKDVLAVQDDQGLFLAGTPFWNKLR